MAEFDFGNMPEFYHEYVTENVSLVQFTPENKNLIKLVDASDGLDNTDEVVLTINEAIKAGQALISWGLHWLSENEE